MIPLKRALPLGRAASFTASVACVLCACAVVSASALGATVIHFERESLSAMTGQLHHGQVHALSFHPATPTGHVHVSLNDGRHMTVAYTSSEQAHLLALARAAGTPVTVATVKPKAAKPAAKHKLRYIAGGLLVVVIIVVLAVLLIDRRRKLRETEDGQAGGEGTPAPSPTGEQT
jgi:hypothetical protein